MTGVFAQDLFELAPRVQLTLSARLDNWDNYSAHNRETTIATGKTHFWSRSRQKFWMKGETSGHTQVVKDISFDCDGDTLLIQVEQTGAACHEGFKSCFFRAIEGKGDSFKITEAQLQKPEQIYSKK